MRLVGSLTRRVEHVMETQGVGERAALDIIRMEDRGRRRYLKTYYGKNLEDPLLYNLIINTDLAPYEIAATVIGEAILGWSAAQRRGSR